MATSTIAMTSKAFSIYFLFKGKRGLGNLSKKIRQGEKDSYLGKSSTADVQLDSKYAFN